MREQLIRWYLDYVNDWLTVGAFAEHHGISTEQALSMIHLGKVLHETPHPDS